MRCFDIFFAERKVLNKQWSLLLIWHDITLMWRHCNVHFPLSFYKRYFDNTLCSVSTDKILHTCWGCDKFSGSHVINTNTALSLPIKLERVKITYMEYKRIIYHIISYIISYIITYHIISHIISYIISYHVISYHTISYHVMSYYLSYHTYQVIS